MVYSFVLVGTAHTRARALAVRSLRVGGVARGGAGAAERLYRRSWYAQMLTISRPPPRRCSAACLLGRQRG